MSSRHLRQRSGNIAIAVGIILWAMVFLMPGSVWQRMTGPLQVINPQQVVYPILVIMFISVTLLIVGLFLRR